MRRRRRCSRRRNEWLPIFALALGLGLWLALFCSPRFALFLAAAVLVVLGFASRC